MENLPIDPNDIDALKRRLAELEALGQRSVAGSGAVAQGGGDALGERSVNVGGDQSGDIVTGTQIVFHYLAAGSQTLTRPEVGRQVAGYLRWLQERTGRIELRGIERAGGAPIVVLPLASACVPLAVKPQPRVISVGMRHTQLDADGRMEYVPFPKGGSSLDGAPPFWDTELAPIQVDRPDDVTLSDVLRIGNRLVITGGPGCGKTTVLLHMAWSLATSLLSGQPEPVRSRLGLTVAPDELPLLILVPLASFARYRRSLPVHASAQDKTLAHFISHHLISRQADFDLPADFFVSLLSDGRDVLLLLDGLDEVANEGERAEVRQSVEDLVGGRSAFRRFNSRWVGWITKPSQGIPQRVGSTCVSTSCSVCRFWAWRVTIAH